MRSVVQHNTMVTEVLDSKTHTCVGAVHMDGGGRSVWACLQLPPTSSGGQFYVTLLPVATRMQTKGKRMYISRITTCQCQRVPLVSVDTLH